MSCSLRSSGAIVSSAISRKATTGFLSRSRSIVSGEPEEIRRARWLARRTSSNRLSTLSMQSSTVTRAMRRLLPATRFGRSPLPTTLCFEPQEQQRRDPRTRRAPLEALRNRSSVADPHALDVEAVGAPHLATLDVAVVLATPPCVVIAAAVTTVIGRCVSVAVAIGIGRGGKRAECEAAGEPEATIAPATTETTVS